MKNLSDAELLAADHALLERAHNAPRRLARGHDGIDHVMPGGDCGHSAVLESLPIFAELKRRGLK